MKNKEKQVSVEDIVKEVCHILGDIISNNIDSLKEEGEF